MQCTIVAASYERGLSTAIGNEIRLVVGYTALHGKIYLITLEEREDFIIDHCLDSGKGGHVPA